MNTRKLMMLALAVFSAAGAILLGLHLDGEREERSRAVARAARAEVARQEQASARHRSPSRWVFDARAMVAVFADPSAPEWIDLPDGTVGLPQPDGSMLVASTRPEPSIRPDVLAPFDFVMQHREIARALQESVNGVNGQALPFLPCMKGLPPVEERVEWSVVLHLQGDGQTMRVVDVGVEDGDWPAYFTPEAKTCYLDGMLGKSWPSTEVRSLKIEYPLCVTPHPTAEDLEAMSKADNMELTNETTDRDRCLSPHRRWDLLGHRASQGGGLRLCLVRRQQLLRAIPIRGGALLLVPPRGGS